MYENVPRVSVVLAASSAPWLPPTWPLPLWSDTTPLRLFWFASRLSAALGMCVCVCARAKWVQSICSAGPNKWPESKVARLEPPRVSHQREELLGLSQWDILLKATVPSRDLKAGGKYWANHFSGIFSGGPPVLPVRGSRFHVCLQLPRFWCKSRCWKTRFEGLQWKAGGKYWRVARN